MMMSTSKLNVVTGAFGYSGKYIARRLIDKGYNVRTLTNSFHRENPFGDKIEVYPYNFDNQEKLVESLRGATVLYNTYWVRFNHADFSFSTAISNTLKLFDAARKAGVKRIVHTSITNPSEDSPFEYFRGKAILEKALIESGISYVILRPAVLFGKEDILINNIAWFIRKFPIFGVFGDGNYRLQPIYVDDFAQLAVEKGQQAENCIVNAIGPETFTYRQLVKEIGQIIGKYRPIISISPFPGYIIGYFIGKITGDIIITKEEIGGLMANLLCTDSQPAGKTRLTDWAKANSELLGKQYASELIRRRNNVYL